MTSDAPADARRQRTERLAGLLERARAGEADALDAIVRELNPLLWQVARSQGADPHEAADVVQTCWLELVRRLDEIRSPSALTGWLVTAAKREAWRTGRRRRRTVPVEEVRETDPLAGLVPEPVEGLLAGERSEAVWRCFRLLPERCQRLLRVVAMVDRPDYAAVSEALGMPVGSIGPTRGRCLSKLRDLLLREPLWGPS